MDATLLARIQFAGTVGFHFIFAPLSIGLAWLILWMMTRYVRDGNESYGRLARFWTDLFTLTFAVGVATGFPMEFQFGTNWASYSRFVGDIFGAPLAIEVIFTFFLESTFLAVLAFGWNRVSRRGLWFASLMVAVGATLSAFWILVANSWMQTPPPHSFVIVGHHAVLRSFSAAVFSPSMLPRFLHTLVAALITGAFFMLGISGWFLLKKRHIAASRVTLVLALWVALVTSILQLLTGHYHALQVTRTQPEKLAAFEAMFHTRTHAPFILFGVLDEKQQTVRYALHIPSGLSLLAYFNADARIYGLDSFPRSDWPPLALTFYPFHLMVAIGLFLIGFSMLGVLLYWKKRLFKARWYLFIALCAIPLPIAANELGWMTAEIGRQPWAVYHVLLTRDALSVTVPASHILFSMVTFGIIYLLLFAAWLTFLRRRMYRGPEEENAPSKEVTA